MKRRATSLSPPERFLLEQWADAVTDAFGPSIYLVGSVARAEAWRDVDVRAILDNEEYVALTSGDASRADALDVAFSMWGRQATGLPIDFQFQSMLMANSGDNEGPRVPIGHRHKLLVQLYTEQEMYRELLEAWCAEKGVGIESGVEPGEPARNYELLDRLGVGGLVGLVNDPSPAASTPESGAS